MGQAEHFCILQSTIILTQMHFFQHQQANPTLTDYSERQKAIGNNSSFVEKAIIKLSENKYSQAIHYFQKELQICTNSDDRDAVKGIYLMIAQCYRETGKYDLEYTHLSCAKALAQGNRNLKSFEKDLIEVSELMVMNLKRRNKLNRALDQAKILHNLQKKLYGQFSNSAIKANKRIKNIEKKLKKATKLKDGKQQLSEFERYIQQMQY